MLRSGTRTDNCQLDSVRCQRPGRADSHEGGLGLGCWVGQEPGDEKTTPRVEATV